MTILEIARLDKHDTLSYRKARLDKHDTLSYQKARLDKNLTSFRFLPFGFWLAPKSLNRPLFALLSGRFSRTHDFVARSNPREPK
jgi:hypothetical protein